MRTGFITFALLLAALLVHGTAHAQTHLDLGMAAPVLSGPSLSGGQLNLENYRGRWVFVDFWASWCQPCMNELPSVVELQQIYGGQGKLDVVSISLDEEATLENLQFAISKFGVNYPVVYDGATANRHIAEAWGVTAIPATFLISPEGLIAARDIHPHELGAFVQFGTEDPYTPMHVRSKEQLLASSPSSGWNTVRDLKIQLDMNQDSPPVSHYQVFVTAACGSGTGQAKYYDVRYDLFIQQRTSGDFPFNVQITKTSGDSYISRDVFPGGTSQEFPLPEMTVAVDLDTRQYEFIVPVPSCTEDLGYAVALYDERLGRYIRNGLNRVETGVGIGGY